MSDALQLPTLSHNTAVDEKIRDVTTETDTILTNDGDERKDNSYYSDNVGNSALENMSKNVSTVSEGSNTIIANSSDIPQMNYINGDGEDAIPSPSRNILPQMNVYVLDDTPSVSSQQPVKDITKVIESEVYFDVPQRTGSPYHNEPDTTLSLDKEEPVSDLDKSPPSDHDGQRGRYNNSFDAIHTNDAMMISARADPDDHKNNDDEDSSNDDSSYFASHLPEPNSGRRYSCASNTSQNSNTQVQQQQQQQQHKGQNPNQFPTTIANRNQNNNYYGRESDASLSLSDDSDENINNNNNNMIGPQRNPPVPFGQPPGFYNINNPPPYYQQQQYQDSQNQYHPFHRHPPNSHQLPFPPSQTQQQFPLLPHLAGGGPVMPELYPQQIMPRMHSVNSLASTSSQNSSGSDTSLPDELQNVVQSSSQQQRRLLNRGNSNTSSTLPSGRRSPILGQHPPSRGGERNPQSTIPHTFGSPSTVNLQPSPPMILHSFSAGSAATGIGGGEHEMNIGLLPHPQPHSMTAEQLVQWTNAVAVPHGQSRHTKTIDNQNLIVVGADEHRPPMTSTLHGDTGLPSVTGSRGESDFLYSGDSDNGMHFRHQHHQHSKHAFGEPNRGLQNNMINDEQNLHSRSSWEQPVQQDSSIAIRDINGSGGGFDPLSSSNLTLGDEDRGFKVYWQRWIMLMYMSILNLLSDWTCYSVAPIALLTEEAFGEINAEQLVVVFLIANGIATACEPIILSRLGLRRTILFGSLLLMIGSIIKSGGMPPIIQADLKKGQGEWRVYLGFFLVGLSQPLYQCTPALLSASWFPEAERTLATGVALNANQLGIGFAFIFGTMLVSTSDDIPKYFGLLSILSTLTFLGALVQFDDAPPTPPSDTAKVMRGTLEAKLPTVQSLFESVRNIGVPAIPFDLGRQDASRKSNTRREKHRSRSDKYHPTPPQTAKSEQDETRRGSESLRRSSKRTTSDRRSNRRSLGTGPNIARRRAVKKENTEEGSTVTGFSTIAPSPSPALWGPVQREHDEQNVDDNPDPNSRAPLLSDNDPSLTISQSTYDPNYGYGSYYNGHPFMVPVYSGEIPNAYPMYPPPPPQYQIPYWDPQYAQYAYYQQQQANLAYYQLQNMPPLDPFMSYQHSYPYQPHPFATYEPMEHLLPAAEAIDEGAEPVITILPHHLDIHIRDDQIWLSTRACLARPGFIHSLVSFTVSGVVINTLSTFMDYLVRLNGAGREYTGIVGGTFQFVIMISSLIIGKVCDKTRAYYSITIGMLVLGAFGLAECGVSLDSNSGVSLRWSLIIVALLVGPLQPVSTELGVDVVYPLSENTVLVIQQLFSNLLSAAFIPCFKAMKDVGEGSLHDETTMRPSYTFSFYLLIVVHACATVFFATFNGRYLRYEHELEKQAQEERRKIMQQRVRAAI